MSELPIRCPDCERRHWSISSLMTCPCDREDRHGNPKTGRGDAWLP